MTVATLTQKQLQYPYNELNAEAIKSQNDAIRVAANAGTIASNAFTADATGRATFATGFWDEATVTAKFVAGSIAETILKPSSLTGKHAAVGAAGNTVGILPELFIIACADGAAEVTEKTTLDATYGKIVINDVFFVKGPTTGGTTDSVQFCADAGGTTPVSSVLALDTIAEGGVVRTTSLLNTVFAAGAKFYVKRVQTTNNAGTMFVSAYRVT